MQFFIFWLKKLRYIDPEERKGLLKKGIYLLKIISFPQNRRFKLEVGSRKT
jgi:hypothetical protein